MNSITTQAYDALEALILSDYSMDSEPAETWADEVIYRALNLVDVCATLFKIIFTFSLIIPISSLVFMAPRHLYEGTQNSWNEKSIYPIAGEAAVLISYIPAYFTLVSLYAIQTAYSAIGVILPATGTYGRHYKKAQIAQAKAEIGDDIYSYQPTIDTLAQGMHSAAMNYSKA